MDLSLYVHIPFCSQKCAYCSFYSLGCGPGAAADQALFIDQVLKEAQAGLAKQHPSSVPSVYVGGGTPSSLPLPLWRRLLTGLSSLLADYPPGGAKREWTVEANPESLTMEKLKSASDAGVNRISLGIQSFNEDTLKILGRAATGTVNHRALELLDRHWKGLWSGDLICEIPGQTPEDALTDWSTLKAYDPPHLSLYTLSIEEGTPLADRISRGSYPMK